MKRIFTRNLHYTRAESSHNKFKLRPPLTAGRYVRSTTVPSTALRRTGVASLTSAANLDNSGHMSIKSFPYLMMTVLLLCIKLQVNVSQLWISFLQLSFKTPKSALSRRTLLALYFFKGTFREIALWPPLVYNLNNTEQVAAQRVRNFAPTDSTTKFLDERIDEKVPSWDFTCRIISRTSTIRDKTQRDVTSCSNVNSFSAKIMLQSKCYLQTFSPRWPSRNCTLGCAGANFKRPPRVSFN